MEPQQQIKLTRTEKKIIRDILNGWALITDSSMKNVQLWGTGQNWYWISAALFWRMVERGLIYQQLEYPCNYIITRFAKSFFPSNVSTPTISTTGG